MAEQRNGRWSSLEVRKIETGQGSSSIPRCIKKLQSIVVEGEAWRPCYDDYLTSWNKTENMPGSWEEKFKEA
jgi:hypothetical protein